MATKKTQGKNTDATKKSDAARKSKTGARSSLARDSDRKSDRATQPVLVSVKRGDTGPQVVVLQDALFALLKSEVIKPREALEKLVQP